MTNSNKLADALDELCDAVRVHDRCRDQYNLNAISEAKSAIFALAEHDAQPSPRGWRLVPILATPEMDAAGKEALSANGVGDVDDTDALVTYHAMLAAAPQPTPDECFCDRMYPDSNPNASCGDCPTRDYAPQPLSIPEPSDADVELAWSTLRSTTQPRDSCACDGDMRAVLSGFAARLRERVGQAPGGDGDA